MGGTWFFGNLLEELRKIQISYQPLLQFHIQLNVHGVKKPHEGFLGSVEAGKAYDPTHLVENFNGSKTPILIDQGTADKFGKDQLKTEDFLAAAHKAGVKVDYRSREGYGHNFFFIASFIEDHIEFHARYLKA